jgi:hypothetical protein
MLAVADDVHAAVVAMPAVLDDGDVDVDDVAVLQRPVVGDAVADHVVERRAQRRRVGRVARRLVAQRGRDAALHVHHVLVRQAVDFPVVMPALMCGVSMSSTSDARRPASRMPSMSAAVLRVIVMGRNYPIAALECGFSLTPSGSHPPVAPLHLMHFEGGDALSAFRAQALLAPAAGGVCRGSLAVSARFVHWAAFDARPRRQRDKLAALLTTATRRPARPAGDLVVVMPRLGTVSPWASKASDIARNCGLDAAPGRAGRRVPAALKKRPARRGPSRCRPTSGRPWPRCCTTA